MVGRNWIWLGAGLLVGALAVAGLAQEGGFGGLVFSHDLQEDFEMTVDVTATGSELPPDRLKEVRTHVAVPSHYGSLFSVTQRDAQSILWYRDDAGVVRNVVLDDATGRLYAVQRRQSTVVKDRVLRRY